MLINVVEGVLGFPSQMTDDPVLELAMPVPDTYPMSEERRLLGGNQDENARQSG